MGQSAEGLTEGYTEEVTQLAAKIFKALLVVYVFFFAYEWWKPLPEPLTKSHETFQVPEKGVRFLADSKQKNAKGGDVADPALTKRYTELARTAESLLFVSEESIPVSSSSTFASIIESARTANPHLAMAVVTDPSSTRHGGATSASLERIRKAKALVIETDMRALPDANLFYSSLWRPFFSWWGNSPKNGWLPDPYGESIRVPLRSWLAFYNMRSNESHLLLADAKVGKARKFVTLVMSSDIGEEAGATGKVGIEIDDHAWSSVLKAQTDLAALSGASLPTIEPGRVVDESGNVSVTLLSLSELDDRLRGFISKMQRGDRLDIAARFVSDRGVISDIKDATMRGASVRLIMDTNEEWKGHRLLGMPNRPVAKELAGPTGGALVRWSDPDYPPSTARFAIGKTASTSILIVGGADVTRRDLRGHNVETVVMASAPKEFGASIDATKYFDRLWNNIDGRYTVDYSAFADDSLWKASIYRMMERAGFSYY